MAWFKTDDKLHGHRKTRRALRGDPKRRDVAPMGLWVLAGSWSADHEQDGFVPADELDRWDDHADDLAARLVEAGFWVEVTKDGESGFQFVNWDEFQPTKESLDAKREAARERMRTVRKKSPRSSRGVRANKSGTAREVRSTPSRPDPSPAAAAAVEADKPPLPPPVEILRTALEAARLHVRWDNLTAEQITEITDLVERHGDAALVKSAVHQFNPNRPAAFAQAWLAGWRDLRAPGDLAAVPAPDCDQPGHTGTTRHCVQCAADRKAAR